MEQPPQLEGSYIPYFLPISDRSNAAMVKKTLVVKPIKLSTLITRTLNSLFHTNEVHLFLPYWAEDGDNINLDWDDKKKINAPDGIKRKLKVSQPNGYYELRYSSNNKKEKEFIPPYDPLVVLDHNGMHIGAVYKGNLFLSESAKYLLPLLKVMSEHPTEFFEILGKRWGICLCCKKTLTAESSLERAIGPVCYKRIRRIRTILGLEEVQEGDVIVPIAGEIDHNLPRCKSLYNPDEEEFLDGMNQLIDKFTSAGMHVGKTGLSIMPGEILSRGEILQVKPKYKNKQPGEERGVKYVYYRIIKETYLTKLCLLSLGGIETKIQTKKNELVVVFSFPEKYKKDMSSYFLVSYKEKKEEKHVISNRRNEEENSEGELPKNVHITEDNDYIYVTGNTYPFKEKLKALKGKWDKNKQAWKFVQGSVLMVDIQGILMGE